MIERLFSRHTLSPSISFSHGRSSVKKSKNPVGSRIPSGNSSLEMSAMIRLTKRPLPLLTSTGVPGDSATASLTVPKSTIVVSVSLRT